MATAVPATAASQTQLRVDSALPIGQSYDKWELLLVDDGSIDGSSETSRRYAERDPRRVRYLSHPGHQNRGMSASRNLGLSQANGQLIAFLDSDDVWFPQKLERHLRSRCRL